MTCCTWHPVVPATHVTSCVTNWHGVSQGTCKYFTYSIKNIGKYVYFKFFIEFDKWFCCLPVMHLWRRVPQVSLCWQFPYWTWGAVPQRTVCQSWCSWSWHCRSSWIWREYLLDWPQWDQVQPSDLHKIESARCVPAIRKFMIHSIQFKAQNRI